MLKENVKYLWQLIRQQDGCRCEPVTATLSEFADELQRLYQDQGDKFYVLPLVDVAGDDPNEFVLRFPLMTINSFLIYIGRIDVNPVQQLEEVSNV